VQRMKPEDHQDQTPRPEVPLGVAIDDRPDKARKPGAANDADDRRRALMIIGGILAGVLLVVILGNTVLRPFIVAQHESMLIGVTERQVDDLADLAAEYQREAGVAPSGFADLASLERLETSQGRDQWGTGFVFDSRSEPDGARTLSVRSAGPDTEFGTEDDIVAERTVLVADSAEDN